ncbi:MAG: hypothetical protein PHQ61_07150, partial [Candidatus Omnitrophica bacterium]|nr:hypothetical protein [Candidatus Omnitrophota bacterium]
NSKILATSLVDANVTNDVTMNDNSKISADDTIGGGDVTMMVGNDITMNDASNINAGNDVNITGSSVASDMTMNNSSNINAGKDVSINVGKDMEMYNTSVINAGNDVDVTAGNNIGLCTINAGNDVTLTATAGDITDNNGIAMNIKAKNLYMTAGGYIGKVAAATLGELLLLGPDPDMIDTDVDFIRAVANNGNIFINEKDGVTIDNTVATSAMHTAIGIIAGGNMVLNNLTANSTTLGANDSVIAIFADGGSITDVLGSLVTANYIRLVAQFGIGTALAPLNVDADQLAAISYGTGDIYVKDIDDVKLGIYVPSVNLLDPWAVGPGNNEMGVSTAANNGLINIVATDDMIVNSVVAPNGGVYLESTGGSIYTGNGWCPMTDLAGFTAYMSGAGIAAPTTAMVQNWLMDVSLDPQWGAQTDYFGTKTDYFAPVVIGKVKLAAGVPTFDPPFLPSGPNVIAGGYSYFNAPTGTIGVGSPAGLPGPSGDLTPAAYNPLKVNIQVLAGNLAGNNSALPSGGTSSAGLTLRMGGRVSSPYDDGFAGTLGISGAIQGIVRPGVPKNYYTAPVTPIVASSPGYVFYDDVSTGCGVPFANYPVSQRPVPSTGYTIINQIYPEIPFLMDLSRLLSEQLKFRIPDLTVVTGNQIAQTQGPISLISNKAQLFFYHPLTEMTMYETTPLGTDMYDFIDGNLNAVDPSLLPLALQEEEDKGQPQA